MPEATFATLIPLSQYTSSLCRYPVTCSESSLVGTSIKALVADRASLSSDCYPLQHPVTTKKHKDSQPWRSIFSVRSGYNKRPSSHCLFVPWRGYHDFQDRVGLLWIVREWVERNPYLPELAGDDRQGDERMKKMSNLSRLVELLPWLTVRSGKVSKICVLIESTSAYLFYPSSMSPVESIIASKDEDTDRITCSMSLSILQLIILPLTLLSIVVEDSFQYTLAQHATSHTVH